ncbi:MAG: double-strand break repair protein AddB, partial [Devosia sp.]
GREILATPPNAAEIFGLADSLGEIVDDLTIEGGDLRRLAADVTKPDLAANWQKTLRFLEIALKFWPEELASRGKGDAAALRNELLRRQAEAAPLIFGDRPVIAAGTTGSIPATANLLATLVKLPRGAIVLPGLDNTLSPAAHEALLDEKLSPHGHPQYGLAKLLRRLGTTPSAVTELAPEPRPARTPVVREALALAQATAGWSASRARLEPLISQATQGLAIIVAHTLDEEARAIALAARDALRRRRTVGIISPDQNLSRRIAVELKRFGIAVDDPAGTPLFHSPAGRLLRLILALAVNQFGPVELMALLRNRATTLGLPRADVARLADRIELCLLRGQRLRPGLAGLRAALEQNAEMQRGPRLTAPEREAVARLFDQLEAALGPLALLLSSGTLTADAFANALHHAFADVTAERDGGQTVPIPGGRELTAWAAELSASPNAGPPFPPMGLDSVLSALMQDVDVRNIERRRDDIFIWGQLEARLQHRDLMILAGLNEDIWPQPADPGPWLGRGMRLAAGLEPPERRQGQAAHDFEMALGTSEAIIAFAGRLGTSPALPSRLVQRLEAFLGTGLAKELRRRGEVWIEAAHALDQADGRPKGAERPLPRPPAAQRPRRLSVTEVETLFRSPYDLYAKHTLRLRKLAPLGEEPDQRERGSMIHQVFARFVEEGLDFTAPDGQHRLEVLAAEAFAGLDAIGERRDLWLRRFSRAAQRFLEFERARQAEITARHAEIEGQWTFPHLGGFTLTARADRVDCLADGSYGIIDFKTGGVPSPGEMAAFEAPQLPLEAALARSGGFDGLPPGPVSALAYIRIANGPEAFQIRPFAAPGGDLGEAVDEISRRLQRHVSEFLLSDHLPLAARIMPVVGRRYRGDYDHLARTDEWTLLEGDDSE